MAETDTLDKTILYTTCGTLDPTLADLCRRWLVKSSLGIPIVSVSQKPLDFGKNVCVGDIGRSGISLDIQLHAGLEAIDTKWVMVAEHDCLYSEEHVRWTPPDEEYFYYNINNWLLQYENLNRREWNGMYSHVQRRMIQSQLVCSTKHYLEAMTKKLEIELDPRWSEVYPSGRIAEPGCTDFGRAMRLLRNRSGIRHMRKKVLSYLASYKALGFRTVIPNIDVRHGANYTGHRRGRCRCYTLDPWGTMEDIINAC